jgi:hypothetical protein
MITEPPVCPKEAYIINESTAKAAVRSALFMRPLSRKCTDRKDHGQIKQGVLIGNRGLIVYAYARSPETGPPDPAAHQRDIPGIDRTIARRAGGALRGSRFS